MGEEASRAPGLLDGSGGLEDLLKLWDGQIAYNDRVKEFSAQPPTLQEQWTVHYIVGLMSECDELLREVRWKAHRATRERPLNRANIAEELTDISKYIISLWQLWGFSLRDAIAAIQTKSEILEQIQKQEIFATKPEPEQLVVISDLDGTVADWRSTFIRWCEQKSHPIRSKTSQGYFGQSLRLELDYAVDFRDYRRWSDEFESSGAYRHLDIYPDAVAFLQRALQLGAYLIVVTARPVKQHKRIWADSWFWLKEHGIQPAQLLFGDAERVLLSRELKDFQNPLVILEDNPDLALRMSPHATVWVRAQPYNDLDGLQRFNSYQECIPMLEALANAKNAG